MEQIHVIATKYFLEVEVFDWGTLISTLLSDVTFEDMFFNRHLAIGLQKAEKSIPKAK